MRAEYLYSALTSIADAGREILNRRRSNRAHSAADIKGLCLDLLSEKGEALGMALARDLLKLYTELTPEDQRTFFEMLRDDFEPNKERLDDAIYTYLDDPTRENRQRLESCIEAPRQKLIRGMNMAPNGTSVLVRMREDLQAHMREDASLWVVDNDFVHLFSSWFNKGFLRLERISWQTPASILEKIIHYEAVHAIADWSDLRRRLASDRRCYGFFHPALPGEPLIFIEVALTRSLTTSVQALINDEDEQQPDEQNTAIFYSISNCQRGLRGISFGNFLIKQVVMELKKELPEIATFSTLSPVPGFRRWLEESRDQAAELVPGFDLDQLGQRALVDGMQGDAADAIRDELLKLCAHYLVNAKRGVMPRDPVARFHLGNGARLEQINWLGDTSENGIRQSFGIMVNYLYDLKAIEQNHEAFVSEGRIVLGSRVKRLI